MDPLRFRKRQLFRPEALANFVGALGEGNTPQLLFRWPKRLGFIVVSLFVLSALAWAATAQLPVRVTLIGDVEKMQDGQVCFWGTGPFQKIHAGQEAYLSVDQESLTTTHLTIVAASPACRGKNAPVSLTLDRLGDQQLDIGKVMLKVTVDHQNIWFFIMEGGV
ncbi:MAG: hypothetical protein HWE34_09230 [Methylocystaceae bacterium]|nr:hypothetical protein [Methylocystaceae bacterium]